jgi:hypothetical protein
MDTHVSPSRLLGKFHGVRRDCHGYRVCTVVDTLIAYRRLVDFPGDWSASNGRNCSEAMMGFRDYEDAERYVRTGFIPEYLA